MRRLTISLPELEQGFVLAGGNKKRVQDLTNLALGKSPVAIHPVLTHDQKKVAVVMLTDAHHTHAKRANLKLTFRPVWCKLFALCSMRKDSLAAVLCEFEFGKYWIDQEGAHATNGFSTTGPGCDPRVVENAELALGELLADDRRSHIVKNVVHFIQKSF